MDLNKVISTAYRWIALKFLVGIFIIAFCYAFLVAFFVVSDSWGAPFVLSPSQDRVLSFQPQVISLEAGLNKQTIDLATAKATVTTVSTQLEEINSLQDRITEAMQAESLQLAAASRNLDVVLLQKRKDMSDTQRTIANARALLKQVDIELATKLITKDQAAQRRISLQSALNSATDAQTQAIQLDQTSQQMYQGAATLRGGATSLNAITSVAQSAQLKSLAAQLKIQEATAVATVAALTSSISETERVLTTAKSSPYYKALREEMSVLFVPYSNLDNAAVGQPVYDCYLKVLLCRQVGAVDVVYGAEEYARHPLFKTDLKGRFVGVKFTKMDAARSQVVFIGGRPLLF